MTSPMKEVLRWTLLVIALMVVGPIAGRLVAMAEAPDGGPDATMLLSTTRFVAIFGTLAALALSTGAGVVVARLAGLRSGFFAAGLVLIWPAFQSATVKGVIGWSRSGEPLIFLAIEGALLAVAATGMALLILRAAHKSPPIGPDQPPREHDSLFSPTSLVGFAGALLVGAVLAWLIAREGLKGQTFAAAAFAGVFGAMVGCVVSHRSSPAAFIAGVCALAVIGPIVTTVLHGSEALVRANANTLFPLGWVAPLDWVAGAFFGVPMGMAWGGSMLEKRQAGAEA